jgi:hypothetical protein
MLSAGLCLVAEELAIKKALLKVAVENVSMIS